MVGNDFDKKYSSTGKKHVPGKLEIAIASKLQ